MAAVARAVIPRRARHWIRRRLKSTPPWNGYSDYRPSHWPPEGMIVSAPDFIGVGAQRSGSTWWWAMIHHHPKVFHYEPIGKELRFLLQFFERDPDDTGAAAYASWFPHPPGFTVGEWTPIYLSYPWIGAHIQRVAPNAKILAIVRDPVDRYRSGIELQRQRAVNPVTTMRQVGIGCYARQLAALEGFIDPARVLVLQYERCCEEPEAQLARTFRFLELEPFAVDPALLRLRVGVVSGEKPPLSTARRTALIETYTPDVEALFARYPELDRSLWQNFR